MAQVKQFSRGTATRPIIREPDRSSDVLEARAVRLVSQSGRVVRPKLSSRPSSLASIMAGRVIKGQIHGGVYNGPVGER